MTVETHLQEDFETLLEFLKTNRGFDFTGYKRASLMRRIEKRMQTVHIPTYAAYLDYLAVHPEEFTELFNTILINVTSFFRDPQAWDYLAQEIIPIMLAELDPNDIIRVWTVGCASGEETYTIAMLLAEAIGLENFSARVKVYATDLDEDALNKARMGAYTAKEIEEVPESLRSKYFEHNDSLHMVLKELRRAVIFGRHDVIHDAPISRINLLICRNLLMYLNTETQYRVLSQLHFSIKNGGYMFLGKAEMLLAFSSLFTPVDLKMRVFRSASKPSFRDRLQLIATNQPDGNAVGQLANQLQLREAAFNASPVAQIVVDVSGMLALANDRARQNFNLKANDIGRPFQDLQLSYRPVELRGVIEKVIEEQVENTLHNVSWALPSGENRILEILVSPLHNNGNGVTATLVSFIDITLQVRLQEKLEHANLELETTMSELQSSNEELETTNEELQSTIEELETTNEELQSSNEEMETMNEELQSTNEELEAIGEESRVRSEELIRLNHLLEAIVTSLPGGIIVTDADLRVLSWNHQSEDLWGLRSDEVVGCSLDHLDIGLPVVELQPDLRSVLEGKTDRVNATVQATNRRGKPIECKITVFPLKMPEIGIRGSILIIEDGLPNSQ